MFMHADEPRNNGLSGQIHNFCICRIRSAQFRALQTDDFSSLDDDTLILGRRSTRAVYHAHVIEHEDSRVFTDVRRDRARCLSQRAADFQHEAGGDEQAQKWPAAIHRIRS